MQQRSICVKAYVAVVITEFAINSRDQKRIYGAEAQVEQVEMMMLSPVHSLAITTPPVAVHARKNSARLETRIILLVCCARQQHPSSRPPDIHLRHLLAVSSRYIRYCVDDSPFYFSQSSRHLVTHSLSFPSVTRRRGVPGSHSLPGEQFDDQHASS